MARGCAAPSPVKTAITAREIESYKGVNHRSSANSLACFYDCESEAFARLRTRISFRY